MTKYISMLQSSQFVKSDWEDPRIFEPLGVVMAKKIALLSMVVLVTYMLVELLTAMAAMAWSRDSGKDKWSAAFV